MHALSWESCGNIFLTELWNLWGVNHWFTWDMQYLSPEIFWKVLGIEIRLKIMRTSCFQIILEHGLLVSLANFAWHISRSCVNWTTVPVWSSWWSSTVSFAEFLLNLLITIKITVATSYENYQSRENYWCEMKVPGMGNHHFPWDHTTSHGKFRLPMWKKLNPVGICLFPLRNWRFPWEIIIPHEMVPLPMVNFNFPCERNQIPWGFSGFPWEISISLGKSMGNGAFPMTNFRLPMGNL